MRLLSEGNDANSSERLDKEIALAKAVDAMVVGKEDAPASSESVSEKEQEYEHECREKLSMNKTQPMPKVEDVASEPPCGTDYKISSEGQLHSLAGSKFDKEPLEEITVLNYQRKIVVLYELLSACLANTSTVDNKCAQHRQGYDARHRVALRLLATWLDVKWMKMVRILVNNSLFGTFISLLSCDALLSFGFWRMTILLPF